MKKVSSKHTPDTNDELRPEYDFSQAIRGKHYRPLHEGYTIKIHKTDGTTEVQEVMFEPGTVRLDADIQAYFPDSQAVNQTLRSLLTIMNQLHDKEKKDVSLEEGYRVRERNDNLYTNATKIPTSTE